MVHDAERDIAKIARRGHPLTRGDIESFRSREEIREPLYASMMEALKHYSECIPSFLDEHPVMAIAYTRKMSDVLDAARKLCSGNRGHVKYEGKLFDLILETMSKLPEMRIEYRNMLFDVMLREASEISRQQRSTSS